MTWRKQWPALLWSMMIAAVVLAGCSAPFAGEAAPAPAAEAPAAAEMASSDMEAAVAQSQDGQPGTQSGATNALLNRKMVARATMELVVADANETVRQIESLLAEQGGFISNANLYNDSFSYGADTASPSRVRGSLTLRVPAENLEATMDALAAMAIQVGTRTINREDVTDQYTDLDAQLRNLQATEEELREMLAEVRSRPDATPEDILAVHNRLMEIRGQIEQVQGRKNMLDNLIGLSTIDVTLAPDVAALPVVEEGWRPGAEARNATRALVSTLQRLGTFAIWFLITVLPVLLLILLPIVLLILLLRAVVRRRRSAVTPVP